MFRDHQDSESDSTIVISHLSRFCLLSKHFMRPRSLSLYRIAFILSILVSTIRFVHLFFLSLQLLLPEMTGIAKWFTRRSYVFLCVANLCISTKGKILTYRGWKCFQTERVCEIYIISKILFFIVNLSQRYFLLEIINE